MYNPNRDYCTDGLNHIWAWNKCCFEHDAAYVAQELQRSDVDAAFYACVADNGGWWYVALALPVVAIGGGFLWARRKWRGK